MGTPSNQDGVAREILRAILRQEERSVSEKDLRSSGADVDLLEMTYSETVRPYLDYLHGYRDLETLDPISIRHQGTDQQGDSYTLNPWESVLAMHSVSSLHRQTLQVFHDSLYSPWRGSNGKERVEVCFYLTRRGTWILWIADFVQDVISGQGWLRGNERISSHESIDSLWQRVRELELDVYTTSNKMYARADYLPLAIEHRLREILQATIEERQKRLDTMNAALMRAHDRIEIVRFGS